VLRLASDENVAGSAPAPDGSRVAFKRFGAPDTSGIWIVPMTGGTPTKLDTGSRAYGPAWASDSARLAYFANEQGHSTLNISRVGSSQAPATIEVPGLPQGLPAWSPNDAWIAVAGAQAGGILLFDPAGTYQRKIASDQNCASLLWAADGRTIYALTRVPTGFALIAVDIAADRVRLVKTFDDNSLKFETWISPGLRMSWSPDGTSFLTTVSRANTDIWMLEGFERPRPWLNWWR
jgi:Tol biopolymer transport system component